MIGILQPLFGAAVILAIAVAFSNNRRAINWSTVAWGLSLQILFAVGDLLEGVRGAPEAVAGIKRRAAQALRQRGEPAQRFVERLRRRDQR